ncbi:helix-turn-helix transcriptional regulator [Metabacillus mangrovi]|nr:AraC family transcriptional regulator [Metabacillus mangrovi]
MEAVRESHPFDPMFPLVYFHHMKGNPDEDVSFYHFHDWYEAVFVHEGGGTFFIDKDFYPMKKNDLYLIPGDIIHQANPDSRDPFICSVILFHPGLIQSLELGEFYSHLSPFSLQAPFYSLTESQMGEFSSLLEKIQQEMTGKPAGYRHGVLSILHWLLLLVSRLQPVLPENSGKRSKSEAWMKEVLLYIDLHYTDSRLSLPVLAEQALVSTEHFSRVFKRVTGFTLPSYLGVKRLFKAKELLSQTDHPVSYISDVCGYKSTSYFHSKFKEQLGCTPGDFRRRNRG